MFLRFKVQDASLLKRVMPYSLSIDMIQPTVTMMVWITFIENREKVRKSYGIACLIFVVDLSDK